MTEYAIHSSYVSDVVDSSFENLTSGIEDLVGQEITVGDARLVVGEGSQDGFLGATRYVGRLHTGSFLLPSIRVELTVSPWSSHRCEIGLRPVRGLGPQESVRADRYFTAARTVIDHLAERLGSPHPVLQVAA